MILYAFYQVHGDPIAAGRISKPDQILPYFVVTELPAGFPGLFIAAIYAASMSTISAGINSLTSASLIDFYQRLWAKSRPVRAGPAPPGPPILTLAYGVLVIGLAFLVHAPGDAAGSEQHGDRPGGRPVARAVLPRESSSAVATRAGALVGWFAGVVVLVPVCFATQVSFLWYALIGCLATMAVGLLVSLLGPAPDPEQTRRVSRGRPARGRRGTAARGIRLAQR